MFLLCSTAVPPCAPREWPGTRWLLLLMQKCPCWRSKVTSVFTFSEIALRHGDYSGAHRLALFSLHSVFRNVGLVFCWFLDPWSLSSSSPLFTYDLINSNYRFLVKNLRFLFSLENQNTWQHFSRSHLDLLAWIIGSLILLRDN